MSLVVWLPLTKDLRQQGLGSVQTTNNTNFILKSGGKLGTSCLDLSNTVRLYSPNLVNLKTFSFAFWYRPETSESTINWNDVIGFNDSKGGLFRLETSYSNSYMLSMHNNTQYGIIQDVAASYGNILLLSSASYSRDVWYHIAVTVEEDNNVKAYVNGELKCIVARSDGSITGYFNLGELGGSNKEDGSLNDLRIYDHCLSPMEVKELAKGLVLHYPLDRQGFGQENLLPGSYKADGSTTNKIYGWQANGFGAPEIIKVDNIDCIHLQASCTGKYIPSIVSASKVFLEYGIEYTISCDLKFNKDIIVTNSTPIHYHSGSSSSTDEFNTANINNGHGFYFKSISPAAGTTIPANTWQHYEQHIIAKTTPTDSSLPYLTYRAFIYGAVRTTSETATVNMWLKNWKIEKGSIATPWCPNSSDTLATTMGLNGAIEYDCSGFCNNGTRTGTFTWTSDTPKYSVSTQFNGTQYIQAPFSCGTISEAVSVAVWGYESNWNTSSAERLIGACTKGSGWCIGDYGSENTLFAFYANGSYNTVTGFKQLSVGWHHFVITFDGLHLNYYVDGQLFSSKTFSTKQIATGNYNIEIGRHYGDGCNFKGRMSDVRIYATALSASDVKSLYQNCATIDPDGTIRGQIRS